MKSFRINAVWIIPLVYFLVSILGSKFSVNGEIFPFFHWGLYSLTPQDMSRKALFLKEANGDTVDFYPKIQHKISKVTYYNMLENFVSHINTEQQAQYLAKILTYLPNDHHIIVNKITSNDTIHLGTIDNGIFKKWSYE